MVQTTTERQSCIEACFDCTVACEFCLEDCIGKPNMAECIRLCRDCANICSLCTQFMARGSQFYTRLCAVCADICEACAAECHKHDSDRALASPAEYLDAVCKGVSVTEVGVLKFCPQCWTPGSVPDAMWTDQRSQYCFACGRQLRDRCSSCNEPIQSLKFRFCPYCGVAYKS